MHCIIRWLETETAKNLCPMCRRSFKVKDDSNKNNNTNNNNHTQETGHTEESEDVQVTAF